MTDDSNAKKRDDRQEDSCATDVSWTWITLCTCGSRNLVFSYTREMAMCQACERIHLYSSGQKYRYITR